MEQKSPTEKKKKDPKTPVEKKEKEPTTPAASTIERPVRERKSAERLVATIEKDSSKDFLIEKGRGTALKDIPNVAYKLSRKKTEDTFKLLHTVLFGRRGKAAQVKTNISRFSGFVWHGNEEKQMIKIKGKLDKCDKEKLVEFCDVLDIPITKATRKEDMIAKLLEFLVEPRATTSDLLAEKEQQGTKRKRVSQTASGSTTPSKGSGKGFESQQVREKPYTRTKSPRQRRSPSPIPPSQDAQKPSSRSKHEKLRSPPPLSPVHEKPSFRTRKSPNIVASKSPEKGKLSTRNGSPKNARSRSPETLSPRSKRLKRAKAERDAEKGSEREQKKNHSRRGNRDTREEKDLVRDLAVEGKDRRSGRDAVGNGSTSRHGRSDSPSDRHHRGRQRSTSPYAADARGRNELANSRDSEQRNGDDDSLSKMKAAEETLEAKGKQKPSFELSGKLAAETNRFRGVTLLFNEPPDARKPDVRWRLYVFKGGEVLNEPLYVHRQSCYLFGRERRVADIPTDHPSCSKQHAVLQYRQVEVENADGTLSKRVKPYVMDLGSTNGTFINDNHVEPQRYYELMEKDTVKFGNSSREYVILHENSAG